MRPGSVIYVTTTARITPACLAKDVFRSFEASENRSDFFLSPMGLHREYRRFKQLGASGFLHYHVTERVRPFLAAASCFYPYVPHLRNWREVFACYRKGKPLPPLHFRRGFVLNHEAALDPVLYLVREVMVKGCYRRAEPRYGQACVMVDIGANVGVVTLDWASRLPKVTIHAYEPDPRTFTILEQNVRQSGFSSRVRLFNEAVGDGSSSTIQLYRTWNSTTTTAFPTGPSQSTGPNEQEHGSAGLAEPDVKQDTDSAHLWQVQGETIEARAVSLATVFERAQKDGEICLVKIDAEGAEVAIIEGAEADELAYASAYVVEYHDALRERARERVVAVLERAGFRCETVESAELARTGLIYAWRR